MSNEIVGHLKVYPNTKDSFFKVFSIDNLELFLFEKDQYWGIKTNKGNVCTKEYVSEEYVSVGGWSDNGDSIEINIFSFGIFIANPIIDLIYDFEVREKVINNPLEKIALNTILITKIPTNTYLSSYLLTKLFKD